MKTFQNTFKNAPMKTVVLIIKIQPINATLTETLREMNQWKQFVNLLVVFILLCSVVHHGHNVRVIMLKENDINIKYGTHTQINTTVVAEIHIN